MPCSDKYLKGCAGKAKHASFMIAEYVLNNSSVDKNAEIYECRCGFFHIGTRAKNKSKKLKTGNKKIKGNNEHKRKYRNVRKFKY